MEEWGRGAWGLKAEDFDQTERDHLRGEEGKEKRKQFLKDLQCDKLMPAHSLDIAAIVKQPLL